jgi:hypothetical protein
MKNLITIYNTFKNKNVDREKESLNDIVKGTKSVLTNKLKFKEYIQNYSKTTERYAFKSPGINEYPLFKKHSCLLIPVKRKKINFYEDINIQNSEKNNEESIIKPKKLLFISPKESIYKNKLKHNINTLNISKKMLKNKLYKLCFNQYANKNGRYNSLFLDFFHKWNNNHMNPNITETFQINNYSSRDYIDCRKNETSDNNSIKNIKNENYSELKYDDNKIFNQDYSKFINDKIEYIKKNKIENVQEKLESVFDDINGKEIKLKLESVKIHFKPLKNKVNIIKSYNPSNKDKAIILYVPLYYAFLICHKNFNLFRHILISSITFSNNFETITFNDKIISSSLKEYSSNINRSQFSPKKSLNSDLTPRKNLGFRKLVTKNYASFGNNAFSEHKIGNLNQTNNFSALKNNFLENLNKNNVNNIKKKEEIIHSNSKRNTLNKIQFLSENSNNYDNDNISKNEENNNDANYNSTNYNEYIFLWETYTKTFLITIQMPMISFKYKNLKNEIMAFCDKNLFLYIYKNNFINWDFYVLNYLFSIKAFRKIILNNYSINKKFILTDIFSKTIDYEKSLNQINNKNILSFKNKGKNIKTNNERYNNNLKEKGYDVINEAIIINKNNNKIYNIMNENNESYLFFYTDDTYNNSIIKLYSYLIIIDYDKLNPKLKWKYYLDFKKMKLLNEITKYESLDSFLPKIIKTDFQNGFLSMDFSLFNEFDIEILGYEKKNIINSNKIKNKIVGPNNTMNTIQNNKELSIDIKFPFIKVERIVNNDNKISFETKKIDLDINFLQKINDYKIDNWSKKILEILNHGHDNLNNSINLTPGLSGKNIITKTKNNIKINSFSPTKKFMRSTSFNSNLITSKFH